MPHYRQFAKSILLVEMWAIVGLLAAGVVLTLAEWGHHGSANFFTYRIYHFDHLPGWFAATLCLMVINGFWMFRLAILEGRFYTPSTSCWGEWGAELPVNPLRLFAVNLIAIPGLMWLFVIARANHW